MSEPQRPQLSRIHIHTAQVPAAQLAAYWGSYRAATSPRRRDIVADGSANKHADAYSRQELRKISRDLERNNHFYDGFLSNWTAHLVGPDGPTPAFACAVDDWSHRALDLFRADAEAGLLDLTGRMSWPIWVATLARGIARDGESALWQGDGEAAIIEADRIHAIDTDETTGRLRTLHLAAVDRFGVPQPIGSGGALSAEAYDHLAWRTRAWQLHGVPVCAAGLDDWERLDSLQEAEIISAEAASLPWTVLETKDGQVSMPDLRLPGSDPAVLDGWQRSDAGHIMGMPRGISATPWAPDRPNLNVCQFVKMVLRHLCMPLLPYEVAFLDVENLSYAGTRGLGRLANTRLQIWQSMLQPPLTRLVRRWARKAQRQGRLPPGDFALSWRWPKVDIRDREKDATAAKTELETGTTSLAGVVGPDWEELQDQRDREARRQILLDRARAAWVADLDRPEPTPDPAPESQPPPSP
jgi:capsid protein